MNHRFRFVVVFCTTLICGVVFFSMNTIIVPAWSTIKPKIVLVLLHWGIALFMSFVFFVTQIIALYKKRLRQLQTVPKLSFIQSPYSIQSEYYLRDGFLYCYHYICLPSKRRLFKLIRPHVLIGTFYYWYRQSGDYESIVLDFRTRRLRKDFLTSRVKALCQEYERNENVHIKIYPL